ncbi:MAG: helix-turn-helix domain-containing protein [Acidobacteria bacterium]|nr:helix-turn-helix domain-containing protein [Acidobacteriota bacterium]MBS1864805.1 helix-turn-helix domain-containing protein [Acidobacteriota bacterium]
MADRAQFLAEVERLVASHTLHGSESLCKLLRYLAKQAVEHPGVPVKEYQIATEVFGRQADFDPQLDSMVRVQVGRLRSKLSEYYSSEGINDLTGVEIPKGSYAVVIHDRQGGATASNGHLEASHNGQKETRVPRFWVWAVVLLSVALTASLALLARTYAMRQGVSDGSQQAQQVPAPIRIFWKGFVTGPEEPWAIFSNAEFVGRPDSGMRYYDAAKDGKSPILDHYTGVGEVLAVHNLDRVFSSLRQSLRVKRGSLFSLDDAKNNDLIFIGSPSENLTLKEIPSTREFVFQQVQSGPRAGNMEIINKSPRPGEPSQYLATPGVPLTEDFAIVALVRAINPEHSELILAGTSTLGTQAAVEFVTRENYLAELLKSLDVTEPAQLAPFEAVIRVKVAKGVPVESEIVALRKLKN